MPKKTVAKKARVIHAPPGPPIVPAKGATVNGIALSLDYDKPDEARAAFETMLAPPPPLVYVAGPMSGIEQHNAPAFDAVAAQLRAVGLEAVSPAEIMRANPLPGINPDGSIDEATYCDMVRLTIQALLTCNAVVLLPGFSQSRGAAREIVVAIGAGIPIVHLGELLERKPIAEAAQLEVRAGVVLTGTVVTMDRDGRSGPPTFTPILPQKPTEPVHDSAGEGGSCTVCLANHLRGE